MTIKHAVALAAALAIALPAVTPAFATGSRLDRDEMEARRAKAKKNKPVWTYVVGSEQVGPLSSADLLAAAEAGSIKADTQVHHPEAGWRAASQVPELADALD